MIKGDFGCKKGLDVPKSGGESVAERAVGVQHLQANETQLEKACEAQEYTVVTGSCHPFTHDGMVASFSRVRFSMVAWGR